MKKKHKKKTASSQKQSISDKKAVCDKKIEEMGIEEFNCLLLGYLKSPPRSKF